MTINFFEPGDIPQPRDKVKIELLAAEALPDRWRVKINVNVTPFMERPSLALALVRDDGVLAGDMTVIETMHPRMEFTLHVRYVDDPAGDFSLKVRLYYDQALHVPYDEGELALTIPPAVE